LDVGGELIPLEEGKEEKEGYDPEAPVRKKRCTAVVGKKGCGDEIG